ncbi:hypothetical protein [Sorangium sp. So ce131]|uniref:hypothetical protein n=1 Tax=Sorangium sp. So ce131 TaxID=3133282 RepID=UPI003F60212D
MRIIKNRSHLALSRRTFISTAAAGVAGVATGIGAEAHAQAAFRPRVSGLTLTSAHLAELRDAISRGGYSMLKVVATSNWGLYDRSMTDPATISELCALTPITLVRTFTGDRGHVDANQVEAEIAPWYAAKARKSDLIIELGNEPNTAGDHTGDNWRRQNRAWKENYIWENRYYLTEAIARCRQRFPQAKIVTCSLAPRADLDVEWFLQIYAQGADSPLYSADFVALHAYNGGDERWDRCHDLPLVLNLYGRYASTKSWIMTEVGLHTDETRAQKGSRMAGLMHYAESNPVLPWNVWGFCYFHLALERDGRPLAGDRAAVFYGEGDSAYKQRVDAGRLRQTPIGWLDGIDSSGVATGWAVDPDLPASVRVQFWLTGPGTAGLRLISGANMVNADLPRLDVNAYLQMAGDHGFSYRIPDSLRNGTQYNLHAFAFDRTGDLHAELSGSPKPFRF